MAISNGYASLTELKGEIGVTDTGDDTELEVAIEAASRAIDEFTRRRFWFDASDDTRVYTARFKDLLHLGDDLVTVTTLKTDETGDGTYDTTWATTDYVLEPGNAPTETPARPYTRLRVAFNGDNDFPTSWAAAVQIVGVFGWPTAAPIAVKKACLIQALHLFRRKDAPFGVAGVADFGVLRILTKLDPDVQMLVAPYRKLTKL